MKLKDPDQLQRWRKRRDLKQWELAVLSGCTQQTISLLETGKMTTLSEDLAIKIAKRLDLSWEDLFMACEAPVVPEVTNDLHGNMHPLSA
ncbi:DNA-binding XRE family transcriptional regulator [Rhodococcus rhodochrous J38]|uniref:helix-turn-helix transcriptional regulator n=1 Tax=Rhodococcus rhodochrous TaxID=1829 RepID=UPI0011A2A3AA|nr:helix-turn-helix transcriptional regulator [Rhodococcus rhodochrous]TWH37174.1 DNA-binding XRE family transcriptional regulator [Rhodococcus rhodochrous J38]